MPIMINKASLAGAPASPEKGGDNQGVQTRQRRGQPGAYSNFDFSEQALLGGDPFSGERENGDDKKQGAHEHVEKARSADERKDCELERMLAMAIGAQAVQGGAAPTAPAAAAPVAVSVGAGRVDEIMQRIEQTIRLSLHGDQMPPTMTIQLGDLQIDGLRSLQISMSAKTLDVSVARDPGALNPELVAAAQGLAQRLATRFPTRVVRVLDIDDGLDSARREAASASGLKAIGGLLTGGRRSA